MKKTIIALALIAAPAGAQTNSYCYQAGAIFTCNTQPQPGTQPNNVNQGYQQLLDTTGQQGAILEQAQRNAQERRYRQQQLELQRMEINRRRAELGLPPLP